MSDVRLRTKRSGPEGPTDRQRWSKLLTCLSVLGIVTPSSSSVITWFFVGPRRLIRIPDPPVSGPPIRVRIKIVKNHRFSSKSIVSKKTERLASIKKQNLVQRVTLRYYFSILMMKEQIIDCDNSSRAMSSQRCPAEVQVNE